MPEGSNKWFSDYPPTPYPNDRDDGPTEAGNQDDWPNEEVFQRGETAPALDVAYNLGQADNGKSPQPRQSKKRRHSYQIPRQTSPLLAQKDPIDLHLTAMGIDPYKPLSDPRRQRWEALKRAAKVAGWECWNPKDEPWHWSANGRH